MGYLWMIISCFFYALMGVFVKLASDAFSSFELVAARGLFAIAVIGLWAFFSHHSLKTRHLKAHLIRSVCGTISLLFWFIAREYRGLFVMKRLFCLKKISLVYQDTKNELASN